MRINITDDAARVGQALRILRKAMGPEATLATIAGMAGLSVSFLSDLERGATLPSLSTLQKLACLYGTGLVIEIVEHPAGSWVEAGSVLEAQNHD